MAYNYEYPYTDPNRYNSDWILNRVKEVSLEWIETRKEWNNTREEFASLKAFIQNYFAQLDLQDEVNVKLDIMARDGSLSALISPLFSEYKKEIDRSMSEQNDKINVLNSRMDTFTSLPDGSTAGDAELQDIRIGYNGKVYHSAGDAVRMQVSDLKEGLSQLSGEIAEKFTKSKNILQLYTEEISSLGVTVNFDGNTIIIDGTTTEGGNVNLFDYISFMENDTNYMFSVRYVSGSLTAIPNVALIGMYTKETATLLNNLDIKDVYTNGFAEILINSSDVKTYQYPRITLSGPGITFNNLRLQVMLEEGTETSAFDDYGNFRLSDKAPYYTKNEVDYLIEENSATDVYMEKGKGLRIAVATDLHCGSDCGGYYNGVWQSSADFTGMTYQERMQLFVDSVNKENRVKPIDMLLITGDISVNGESTGDVIIYLKEFINDYACQLDMPVFFVRGNHDPYTNEDWKEVVGYDIEFSIETDDYYFICLDSYKVEESGEEVPYTGFDTESMNFFKSEIQKAGNKKIFVCSHYFNENDGNEEFWREFYTNPNIIGRIEGHAHMWLNAWTSASYDGVTYQKYRANSGGFCYPTTKWEDGISNTANLCGFRIIESDADAQKLYTYQIQPAHSYTGIGIDLPYTIGSKSSMGTINKNPRANFYVGTAFNSDDRITRAISDLKKRVTALENS